MVIARELLRQAAEASWVDPPPRGRRRGAAGDLVAAASLMRALDDDLPGARAALRALYPHGGRAFVVGVTGAPGVGKSTLVDALVGAARAARRAGGGRGRRSLQPVLGRRAAGRSGAHAAPRAGRRRVHPVARDARAAGRAVAIDDGDGGGPRRCRLPAGLHRDRRGGAGGDRHRRRGRRRHGRDGARPGRRGAGAEGRPAGDRRHPGGEQGRSRRGGPRDGRPDDDAGDGRVPVPARRGPARGAGLDSRVGGDGLRGRRHHDGDRRIAGRARSRPGGASPPPGGASGHGAGRRAGPGRGARRDRHRRRAGTAGVDSRIRWPRENSIPGARPRL